MIHPQPKPEPRKRIKGRKLRAESKVAQRIRVACVERDGDCRLGKAMGFSLCLGASEWAHLGEKKRARTRGMKPAQRHTTAGSLMLCTAHHRQYDAGELLIEAMSADGADGWLLFEDASLSCASPSASTDALEIVNYRRWVDV